MFQRFILEPTTTLGYSTLESKNTLESATPEVKSRRQNSMELLKAGL